MKRFLSTTAIVLTMTGAAFADAHSEGFGNVAVEQTDFLASDLIGMRIYNSEAEVDAATPLPMVPSRSGMILARLTTSSCRRTAK